MDVTALEAFGIDKGVLRVWKETGHGELLPVQMAAIRRGKVLDGGSAVIFSPTSSGKTFVGEMAAVRTARQNKRVIYLVPQKALAEEKYREFKRKYAPFGIRIVISTRDRKEHDRAIHRGQFHIAIVVFEKFQALMVASPALLRNVGLAIIDEMQMIGDKTRGAGLEILLTKILLAESKPQIIGLSAVLGNAAGLAKWMGATLVEERKRPVELRKGVLCGGRFRYAEHNSGNEGVEQFSRPSPGAKNGNILVAEVRRFVKAGEQCIVFCSSRAECIKTATAIAEALDTQPAAQALNDLSHLEDSQGKDILTGLLAKRVAYHSSDLDWDQRDVIERWFKSGEIAVVCATTTLAMGINFPARNVFLDPNRWDRDRTGQWSTVPIPQAEYENMSGRAGRLGLEKEFGRAIIVADSQFDADTLFDAFVKGDLGDVEPTLDNVPLSHHLLNLIASGLCRTPAEIRDVLLASYTGVMHWQGGEREKEFSRKLEEGLEHCLTGGLVAKGKRGLEATPLGKLAAAKGITVDTAIEMASFIRNNAERPDSVNPFEVIWCLSGTECGEAIYFNLATPESRSGDYPQLLQQRLARLPRSAQERVQQDIAGMQSYESIKRMKKALLLYDWGSGMATRRIETRFHCFSGSIYGLATEFAWLAETMAGMAKILGWPENAVARLMALSQQLIHGVQLEGLELAATRVRGLGRGRISELVAKGWTDLKTIASAPADELRTLLTRPVAELLQKRAAASLQAAELGLDAQDGFDDVTGTPPDDPEYAEWSKEFPPSDDLGAAYRSSIKVHLDGRAKDRRHLVLLDEKEAWLTENSFEAILKLAAAAHATELGWVVCTELGTYDTYHQVVRRLKIDLKADGVETESLVENNKTKHYRLSVPPQNITINDGMVLRHFPKGKAILKDAGAASGAEA